MATLIGQSKSIGQRPKYRVWHAYNIPNNMDYYAVGSPEEAKSLIEFLAREDLKDCKVTTNAFGLEELESDGYHEWYDDDGHSVNEMEVKP